MSDTASRMNRGVTLVLNCLRSGGAEKQLLWIAAEIARAGTPCHVFELGGGERSPRIERMVDVAVAHGVRILRAPRGSRYAGSIVRLWRHLRRGPTTLLWSWGLRADVATLLAAFAIYPRVRRLVSVRSASPRINRLGSSLHRVASASCDGLVSNTHAALNRCSVRRGDAVRAWILPNAVLPDDRAVLELPAERPCRPVLAMLGNVKVRTKGYDIAARTARILSDRGITFELRIAGRPDEWQAMETILRSSEVGGVVRYRGEVSQPEEFLREAHLYLLLSRFEGMPNTLLEALNVGLPAIATDVGDLRSLKEQGAPFDLIPTEDAVAAADAVERALRNWPETRARAAQGRAWVQAHFSEERSREILRGILKEVMES